MAALPNIAAEYLRGLEIGSHISQEHRRLQFEREQLDQRAQQAADELEQRTQAQMAVQTREAQDNAARLQVSKAYHEAQLGLRGQRLAQFAQANAAKTQEAARRMADQKGFADDLKGGMTVEQALYRHPSLTTPKTALDAKKASSDLSAERMGLSERRIALAERKATNAENRPEKTGTMDFPIKQPGSTEWNVPQAKGIPLDSPLINQLMGTNAPPGTGTNYAGRASAPMPTPAPAVPGPAVGPVASAPGSPFKEGATIRSKKDNKLYKVSNGVPVLIDEGNADDEEGN